jgi:hypothetical protein
MTLPCLLLLHVGFDLPMVKWIMACVTSISCDVLINGVGSPFFHPGRGLRQGYQLCPYLSIMVVDCLTRALCDAKKVKGFLGVRLGCLVNLTHLLFIYDILIFCSCENHDVSVLKEKLALFSKATGMIINKEKYAIYLVDDQG